MYHEDVADEDDEGSADEEKEEQDRRQRRAMTTPHVLDLADAGRPGDVCFPGECAGPRAWRVTQMVAPVHSWGTSGMVSATRGDESTFPAPFPSPIHTPSYAQAAALAAATRLSTHAPLLTAHPNTVGMAMSGGQTNCDVPPLHFHKNNDHDDHDDRMAAATVAVVGSGDAPEPTPMPSSSDGQTCAVHAATAAANSLATAPHDRCRSLLQRAPRASTPSANGAYLL